MTEPQQVGSSGGSETATFHDATKLPRLQLASLLSRAARWEPSTRSYVRVFGACIVLYALVCIPTLTLSPPVWMDEAHIVEYGRLFFNPDTDWSPHWQGDHPVMPWYVAGAALEELVERLTLPSIAADRVFSLTGALLSATMLALWLRQRNTQALAACLLAFTYLFDPMFVQPYRGGRMDGWAQCSVFTACYLLGAWRARGGALKPWAAGGSLALGFFVWPSVSFLLPLVLFELLSQPQPASSRWRAVWRAGLGAAIVGGAIALVIVWQVPRVIGDIQRQLQIAGMTPTVDNPTVVNASLFERLSMLLSLLFMRSPWHVVLLSWGAFHARSIKPLLWMLLPFSLILSSLIYNNRVLYLLPYLIVFYAGAFPSGGDRPKTLLLFSQPLGLWLLALSLASAGGVSVAARSLNAWLHRSERSESRVFEAAREVPAFKGPICITMEFYFIGRSLGWHMFSTDEKNAAKCEVAIFSALPDTAVVAENFKRAGFVHEATLLGASGAGAPVYGARGFGPYEFMRRVRPAEMPSTVSH